MFHTPANVPRDGQFSAASLSTPVSFGCSQMDEVAAACLLNISKLLVGREDVVQVEMS